jgi:hypothetical protein
MAGVSRFRHIAIEPSDACFREADYSVRTIEIVNYQFLDRSMSASFSSADPASFLICLRATASWHTRFPRITVQN